jgi:hypothetical protein
LFRRISFCSVDSDCVGRSPSLYIHMEYRPDYKHHFCWPWYTYGFYSGYCIKLSGDSDNSYCSGRYDADCSFGERYYTAMCGKSIELHGVGSRNDL